jgi:hypothetical protein
LRSTVPTTQREAWYAKRIAEGVQVVIAHPKLVETGLDLLDFPTLIFYETGYSLHTLRQSSRRSWRIGQNRPVRVFFLCQEGTMQTKCLRLMGKKLLVALTLEGKFAGEGLHDLEEDDDMLAALARELVEKDGIGQSADAIWSELKQIYDQLPVNAQPAPPRDDEDSAFASSDAFVVPEIEPASDATQGELLVTAALEASMPTPFGQTLNSGKRRGKRHHAGSPQQPSLFSWN